MRQAKQGRAPARLLLIRDRVEEQRCESGAFREVDAPSKKAKTNVELEDWICIRRAALLRGRSCTSNVVYFRGQCRIATASMSSAGTNPKICA